jgi:hypothetical protein
VPVGWLLRGTAPQNYDLLSDRKQVLSGEASALLKSHEGSISPGLGGSILQTASAAPFLGKRVEVSAYLRAEEVRDHAVALGFTASDANDLLLASDTTQRQFPKITSDWTRVSLVIDVPWAAAKVRYWVGLGGKGAVWVDDVRIIPVDRTVRAVTLSRPPLQIGQPLQPVSDEELFAQPQNLGFEDTVTVDGATLRQAAPPSVTGIRQ